MNKKHYFIICQNLNLDFKKYEHCKFIGVESGNIALINNKLKIELACGDFDSISWEEEQKTIIFAEEIIKLEQEKDILDSEFAIKKAIEKGALKITLAVSGKRWDMNFALIFLLEKYQQYGLEIIDENNHIMLIKKSIKISTKVFKEYKNISFLPLVKSRINILGFKYPLDENHILNAYDNYFISNCFNEDEAIIEIKVGYGILSFSK